MSCVLGRLGLGRHLQGDTSSSLLQCSHRGGGGGGGRGVASPRSGYWLTREWVLSGVNYSNFSWVRPSQPALHITWRTYPIECSTHPAGMLGEGGGLKLLSPLFLATEPCHVVWSRFLTSTAFCVLPRMRAGQA